MKTNPDSESLHQILKKAEGIAQLARRHNQALSGGAFYARKFAGFHAKAVVAFDALSESVEGLSDGRLVQPLEEIKKNVQVFFMPDISGADRTKARTHSDFLLKTAIEPALLKAKVKLHEITDAFFPLDLVSHTGRTYIIRIAEQACGAYDLGWFDCAAVMARRLLETLIIEVYEAKKIDSKLKKSDGTFHQLGALITVLQAETAFNISRNTKTALPKLKDLGDTSAHSRHYIARKPDLDKVQRELRITIEELVHLANFQS